MVVEERSSLQSQVPSAQGYSLGRSAENLTLFQNKVGEHVLQVFLACDQKRKIRGIVEGTLVSFARLEE